MNTKPSSLSSMVPATDAMSTEKPHKAARSARWAMLNTFTDEVMRNLTPLAANVWLILFRSADGKGLVRMSQEQIAEKVGQSTRQVRRGLTDLRRHGCVEELSRGNRNKGPSRYRIYAGSTGQICPIERLSSTGQIRPVEAIPNRTDTSYRNRTDMSSSSERIIKTPAAAEAALAGEEDLRAKSVEIGGQK